MPRTVLPPTHNQTKEFIFNHFLGMNTLASPLTCPPDYAVDIQNGYIIYGDTKKKTTAVTQREGIVKLNTTVISGSPKIRHIGQAKWQTTSTDIIVRAGTAWWKYNSSTRTFDSFDSGRSDDVRATSCMFNNRFLMADGGRARKSTAAYAISNLSTDAAEPTNVSLVHTHNFRVVINDDNDPMKLYLSKVSGDFGTDFFSASNDATTIDLKYVLPEGDQIIGFATFAQTFLVIFLRKFTVIYNVPTTTSNISIVQIIRQGCLAPHGFSELGPDLAFIAQGGIQSLKSSITNQDLDYDDLDTLNKPLYRTYLSGAADEKDISVVWHKKLNHLYIAFPSTSTCPILVYSLDFKNIVGRFSGITANSFLEADDGTLYCGGAGYVYEMHSGNTDDGAGIYFSLKMPYLYFGNPNIYKGPRQLEFLAEFESNLTIYFNYWFGLQELNSDTISKSISLTSIASFYRSALYRAGYYRASGKSIVSTKGLVGRGKMMQCEIWHNTSGARVTIDYFILRVLMEGEK